MDYFVLVGGLLVLTFSPAAPMCLPTDYTLYVEKPECSFCVAINTTICTGFCYSRVGYVHNIAVYTVYIGPGNFKQTTQLYHCILNIQSWSEIEFKYSADAISNIAQFVICS